VFGKAHKSVVLSKCEWYEQSSQKLYRDHVLVRAGDRTTLRSLTRDSSRPLSLTSALSR
jgi:hypothetical protein